MLTRSLLTVIATLLILSGCGEAQQSAKMLNLPAQDGYTGIPVIAVAEAATPATPDNIHPQQSIPFLMGQSAQEKQFVTIDERYASRKDMTLQAEVYDAFKKMHKAAEKDGIQLVIKSATRNFDYQKQIWDGKWTGARKVEGKDLSKTISNPVQRALKILENSSMPGSSRHHWGTDIDLNAFTNDYFSSGKGKQEYAWLQANAARFGFCQPYTRKGDGRDSGYNEERWHWTYMPLSKPYTVDAIQLLKNNMFRDFKGAETAASVGIVENYVAGINKQCLQ
ncbi:MAG: D-alanyl-D-alanine carboxypeptidase family protein [Thiolinea sp.]